MLGRVKHYFFRPKNLRDKLRNQEKIIETLIRNVSRSEQEFKLFKFIVENKESSRSRNYSDLVALFYLGKNKSYLEIGAGEPIIGSERFFWSKKCNGLGYRLSLIYKHSRNYK